MAEYINKSTLLKSFAPIYEHDRYTGLTFETAKQIITDHINSFPTVDAIPVEWIKKYIVDNTKVIDDLKYEVGANPVNYYIYPQQIAKMLTAWWEKENE